jgi:ribose-phosphate pyrophosphokinase
MDSKLADEEVLFIGNTGHSIRVLEYGAYPSGEPLIKFVDEEWRDDPPHCILLRQRSMSALLATLFWVDALAERGVDAPKLFIPQVPGARQDRLNDSGDFLFTAKSVAGLINARRFPAVGVLDPHSDVITALLDRCLAVHPTFQVAAWNGSYVGVIAPDAGAEKRARLFAQANNLPLFHAWKTRDVSTGSISGFGVEPLQPGHYLVVDDLCDAGGTFIGLAGVLAAAGCTADLYVTHGLFTRGTQPLLDCYTQVITTDSTVGEKPGVHIIPVCMDFLRNS